MGGSAHLNYALGAMTIAGGTYAVFKTQSQASFFGGLFIGRYHCFSW